MCTHCTCMKNFVVKCKCTTQEIFKFELTKYGPLFVAIMLGSSNWANSVFNYWMMTLVMDKCIRKASIHLGPASIITRNIWFKNSPALRERSLDDHSKGFSCATVGAALISWHSLHPFTIYSIKESMFGHHITISASPFILDISGCPICSSCNYFVGPCAGMTTCGTHLTQLTFKTS